MRKFFIAAGHGWLDPGACFGNVTERDEVIEIVDEAVKLLAGQVLPETEIVVVPHKYDLNDEVRFINESSNNPGHDLCLELHLNSNVGTPGTGTETYFGHTELTNQIHNQVVEVLGLRDRGIKDGRKFYFNAATIPASCILEMGFLNNPEDLARVRSLGGLALARAVCVAAGGVWAGTQAPSAPPSVPFALRAALEAIMKLLQKVLDSLDD